MLNDKQAKQNQVMFLWHGINLAVPYIIPQIVQQIVHQFYKTSEQAIEFYTYFGVFYAWLLPILNLFAALFFKSHQKLFLFTGLFIATTTILMGANDIKSFFMFLIHIEQIIQHIPKALNVYYQMLL